MRPAVSIIILAHNRSPITERCLLALKESTYRPIELLITDNGSTDDTPEVLDRVLPVLEEAGISVVRLRNESNIGCATARNHALQRATGNLIKLMDNDVVVRTRSWAEKEANALEGDPSIGLVGGKLIFPNPPHLIQFAGGAVSPKGRVGFLGRGMPRNTPEFNEPRFVQCYISAQMMFPRRILEEVGYLDEDFNPFQFEDIDYCYRIRESGYRILYLPDVEMYHFENVTTGGTVSPRYRYITGINYAKFRRKWRHRFQREGGPRDEELRWRELPRVPLESIGSLELTR